MFYNINYFKTIFKKQLHEEDEYIYTHKLSSILLELKKYIRITGYLRIIKNLPKLTHFPNSSSPFFNQPDPL